MQFQACTAGIIEQTTEPTVRGYAPPLGSACAETVLAWSVHSAFSAGEKAFVAGGTNRYIGSPRSGAHACPKCASLHAKSASVFRFCKYLRSVWASIGIEHLLPPVGNWVLQCALVYVPDVLFWPMLGTFTQQPGVVPIFGH